MALTHGLASTYRTRNGCRCDECREANTARVREEQRRRAERLAADPSLAPHGVRATYSNWGCRCEPCTEANSAECRDYKARRKAERQAPS